MSNEISEAKFKQPLPSENEQFLRLKEIVYKAVEEKEILSVKLLECKNRQCAVNGCLTHLKAEIKVPGCTQFQID